MTMGMDMATGKMRTADGDEVLPGTSGGFGRTVFRILLIVAAVALAVFAFCNALANVAANRQPSLALKVSPERASALNAIMQQKLSSPAVNADELRSLALRSLGQQLLNPPAMRTLGLSFSLKEQQAPAARAVLLAEKMSRRDLGAQLWLIEDNVQRGDMLGALSHYDIALRGSQASAPLLFPILAEAISDAEIRRALKPYIRAKTAWAPQFILFAIGEGKLENTTRTMLDAGGVPAGPEFASVSASLIPNLATNAKWDLLKAYYSAMPGADPALLQTASFSKAALANELVPLSWAVTEQTNLFGGFQAEGSDSSILTASAEESSSGWVAQKILFLPSGNFAISADFEWTEQANGGLGSIAIYCGQRLDSPPILRLPLEQGKTSAKGSFAVPVDCSAQVIRFELHGGDDQRVSLWAKQVDIRPAG